MKIQTYLFFLQMIIFVPTSICIFPLWSRFVPTPRYFKAGYPRTASQTLSHHRLVAGQRHDTRKTNRGLTRCGEELKCLVDIRANSPDVGEWKNEGARIKAVLSRLPGRLAPGFEPSRAKTTSSLFLVLFTQPNRKRPSVQVWKQPDSGDEASCTFSRLLPSSAL